MVCVRFVCIFHIAQAIVVFSIPWSLAAVIDLDSRQKFDQYFRDLVLGKFKDHPVPDCLTGKLDLPPSEGGLVYDFCWDVRVSFYVFLYWSCTRCIKIEM